MNCIGINNVTVKDIKRRKQRTHVFTTIWNTGHVSDRNVTRCSKIQISICEE